MARLREVAQAEGMEPSDDVLHLIAHSANGSLRDALGLLDQVSAAESGPISEEAVRQALGLADPDVIARLTDALLAGEVGDGLDEIAAFVSNGGDPRQLANQFTSYFPALLHTVVGSTDTSSLDPGLKAHVGRHAAQLNEAKVLGVLHAFTGPELSPKYDLIA